VQLKAYRKLFYATVVLVLLPRYLLAGQGIADRMRDKTEPRQANSDGMVRLWVLATRKNHHVVQDLTSKDFRIYEDKVQQPITYFEARPREPIRLGILIDESQGRLDEPEQVDLRQVSEVLRRLLGPNDRAFVAEFGQETSLLSPWTSDFSVLDEALQRVVDSTPEGGTALYDAIVTLAEERFGSESGRKALVVIGGTPDDSSSHTELESLESLRRADTIVYPLLPWVKAENATIFRNVKFAQVFSADSGGVLSLYTKPKEFKEDLEGVGISITHFYAIGYAPRSQPHDGRYHQIKVKCLRPGVKIFTREGYYAPKG